MYLWICYFAPVISQSYIKSILVHSSKLLFRPLFRRLFRTAMFCTFSKVAIATSNFMNEFYNGGFAQDFIVSMLKKNHRASSRLCIRNEEIRSKTCRKHIWKRNMKSFSNETLNSFLQKVLFLLQFGSCENCMSSANVVPETHQKLCNKRVLSTGKTMYLWICYFSQVIPQRCIKYTLVHKLEQSNIFTRTWFSSAQNSFITKFLVNFCKKTCRAHTVLARSKM